MSDLFPVTLDEQIACVRRELEMREHVYQRRILSHKMTQKTADREMSHMQAVLATLLSLKEKTSA
jgi:phage gp16-like protein